MTDMFSLLRFVRDTDAAAHRLPALDRNFPSCTVGRALRNGYLAQQRWGATSTEWIDLTQRGEQFLIANARQA